MVGLAHELLSYPRILLLLTSRITFSFCWYYKYKSASFGRCSMRKRKLKRRQSSSAQFLRQSLANQPLKGQHKTLTSSIQQEQIISKNSDTPNQSSPQSAPMNPPEQKKKKQLRKLLSTFICVCLGILVTNTMSYIVNNLEPNAFIKVHAIPLLVGLSVILTVLTMIVSTDRETLLPFGWNAFATWGKQISPFLLNTLQVIFSLVMSLVVFALFIGSVYFFIQLGNINDPVAIKDDAREVILAQKYCAALQKQDYIQAYSYYGRDPSTNPILVSKEAYIAKARSLDQKGKIKSCTIAKETHIHTGGTYSMATNSSYEDDDFVLELRIGRENQSYYLVHLTIHVFTTSPDPFGASNEWINDIDRL